MDGAPARHLRRDLVYGLLAQQMNLITREQLLEAANLWLDDPSRGIPSLLGDLGHLQPEDQEQVQEALDAHVSPTGSDSGGGASLTVDPSVRESLLALRPPVEIRQWLIGLGERRRSVHSAAPRGSRYELGRELGRGGLGRVIEARDRDLDREVAIKVLHDDLSADAAERFEREARISARLDHPNVVPVHDFGSIPGESGHPRLFLCMKRVIGTDLGRILEAVAAGTPAVVERWTRARLLGIFEGACLGVAYAHSRKIVHRDLKPSNIMVGDFGEVYVVDWGLARDLRADEKRPPAGSSPAQGDGSSITWYGDVVGTPAYMAPEQAEGRTDLVDERTDVFALGGILYAILTQRPPYEGETASEVLENVRAGRISPPSAGAPAPGTRPGGIPPPPLQAGHLIPRELEAICMKALARRREDRYPTVRALHDDIRLFLEGVAERERRQRASRMRLEEGIEAQGRFRTLGRDVEAQREVVNRLTDEIQSWESIERKRPLWAEEEKLAGLEEARVESYTRALAAFGQALQADPENDEASRGTCELLFDRCLEADQTRDRAQQLLARKTLAAQDRGGEFLRKLDAPGTLTLRAFRRRCDCLLRRTDRGWRVDFGKESDVPWIDSRPRPDVPLSDAHRAVPAIRLHPPGVVFGHSPDCPTVEVPGIPWEIAPYELKEKRLQLGEVRHRGVTPVVALALCQGSWRCLLRPSDAPPVPVPFRITREGTWEQGVHVYRAAEVPEGFLPVPGGPFQFGGVWAGGLGEPETIVTRDIFMARFPVTCREYLEFLASIPIEEARLRVPRENEKLYWIEEGGKIRMPRPEENPRLAWEPDWPVFAISWFDAIAYCAWASTRDGRVYRLPHEEEMEKAIRGVDARLFSFGDQADGTFAHVNGSLQGRITPLPVGSFPIDESPYGIRDVSGGVASLCLNGGPVPYRDWRAMRGGAWSTAPSMGRAGYRVGNPPSRTSWSTGFRLVIDSEAWPTAPARVP